MSEDTNRANEVEMLSPTLAKRYVDRYSKIRRVTPATSNNNLRDEAGRLMIKEGRYEDAVALLNTDEHIETCPYALLTRGRAKIELKDHEGADRDFLSSLREAKRLASINLCSLSLNKCEEKKYDEAVSYAREARMFDSSWALPYVNEMNGLLSNGKIAETWIVLEEMKEVWPESQTDECLIWHLEHDGVFSLLRERADYEARIVNFIER